MPEARLAPSTANASWTALTSEDYSVSAPAGAPEALARTVMVAVPPTGEVHVRGFASGGTETANVDLQPAPGYVKGADELEPSYHRLESAYAASAPAPEAARLTGVSWVRNQRVATIEIRPVEYDAPARRLTVRGSVEVEVDVAPAAPTARPAEALDPFEDLYRATLVNYEQGRAWRRAAPVRGRDRFGRTASLDAAFQSAAPETSVFAGRPWIKVAITRSGFYHLDFGQIRNLKLFSGDTTVAIDSLRMFTWPGFPVLPEDSFCDSCGFREVALQVIENTVDGRLNSNEDAIYFYALGPNGWANEYDPARPESLFINHPYELRNYYYLTVATAEKPVGGTPLRILPQAGDVVVDGNEITPATFRERIHEEQDVEPFPSISPKILGPTDLFWEKFFWRSLNAGSGLTNVIPTPGIETLNPAELKVRMWGVTSDDPCFLSSHMLDVTINGQLQPRLEWNGTTFPFFVQQTFTPAPAANAVEVRVPVISGCESRVDRQALAFMELRYDRRFEPVNDTLTFETPDTSADFILKVAPFTSSAPPRVFDVTDAYMPREITDLEYAQQADGYHLAFEETQASRRRYRVIQPSSILPLATADITDASDWSLKNLRGVTQRADYLVIFYDGFKTAADKLVQWRQSHLPLAGRQAPFESIDVPISAVYDQFSGGRTDPTAIRNFLRAAFENWAVVPAFVTLLGDASYDFKNILGRAQPGQPGAPVPSWESGFSNNDQYATDDWLFNVDSTDVLIPDFYGGRLPANDATQALDLVNNKIIAYEKSEPLGPYRNQLMLVADDDMQGQNVDGLLWTHLGQTAGLDTSRVPEHMDREYVYLHKYPTGPGFTKPLAKAELKANVNAGLSFFNFFGHGSPFKIADETVLLDTDAGTFTNSDKLAMFVAASCDVGKFNDPQVQSLGERMLLAPNGGAIAVISATELAYAQFNEKLARAFYQGLFTRSPADGQYDESIAQALLEAKLGGTNNADRENNSKYQLMGDSGTRLNLPRRWVDLNLYAHETDTIPLAQLPRGEPVYFRGQVRESPGGAQLSDYSGSVDLRIDDSAPYERAPQCPDGVYCDSTTTSRPLYYYRPGTMYRGSARVVNGQFSGSLFVPLEAAGGARGKVRAYLQGRTSGEAVDTDGAGSIYAQVLAGSPKGGDNAGPRITLSFVGGGTSVRPDATLLVDLNDPSGILITDHNPVNGIIVTVDDNSTTRVDITSSFRYLTSSSQAGTATFQLPGLSAGQHTIKVSAADNLAAGLTAATHRSEATIAFEVSEVPPLQIAESYLFPNPVSSHGSNPGGQFVVDARGDSLNALLRIYTISGKLVRTLKLFGGLGQVQIAWDGKDAEGDPLANGTYFYRVQINVRDSEGKSSALQHAVAQGRFVVLNR